MDKQLLQLLQRLLRRNI